MIYIKGICYIVGASETSEMLGFQKNENDLIIAADGGYDLLKTNNIEPDVLIGDFDSITNIPKHCFAVRYPVEKDDTDSFLAYKLGYNKGYRTFVIYGGVGGRMDHTVANLQMLSHMAKHNSRGFLIDKNTVITAINNSEINFSKDISGKIGVFAHSSIANGVNISGLMYCVENAQLTPDFPIGVSNEFIGDSASVSVSDGTLLIVWYETEIGFFKHINTYKEIKIRN